MKSTVLLAGFCDLGLRKPASNITHIQIETMHMSHAGECRHLNWKHMISGSVWEFEYKSVTFWIQTRMSRRNSTPCLVSNPNDNVLLTSTLKEDGQNQPTFYCDRICCIPIGFFSNNLQPKKQNQATDQKLQEYNTSARQYEHPPPTVLAEQHLGIV